MKLRQNLNFMEELKIVFDLPHKVTSELAWELFNTKFYIRCFRQLTDNRKGYQSWCLIYCKFYFFSLIWIYKLIIFLIQKVYNLLFVCLFVFSFIKTMYYSCYHGFLQVWIRSHSFKCHLLSDETHNVSREIQYGWTRCRMFHLFPILQI